jgi:hypothetical protein
MKFAFNYDVASFFRERLSSESRKSYVAEESFFYGLRAITKSFVGSPRAFHKKYQMIIEARPETQVDSSPPKKCFTFISSSILQSV